MSMKSVGVSQNRMGDLFLDVSNVFDRVNAGGYEHQLGNTGWVRNEQKLLPIFPTLSIKVSW